MHAAARTRQLVAAVLLAATSAACGFLHGATHDGYGVSYDELTAMIADVEARRAANEPFGPWVDEQRTLRNCCESWDAALGLLYARRSSAVVRDQTYVSVAGTMLATVFGSSKAGSIDGPGAVLGAAAWTLVGVCCVPVDVVVAPFWFVTGVIGDLGVSEHDLVRAAADLQRARGLGVTETHVAGTGYWGWPYAYNTHLDALGYDAAWLQRHARR